MKKWLIITVFSVVPMMGMAADISAPHLKGNVTLDGRLNEPMWRAAARLSHTAFKRWVNGTYNKDPTIFHMRFFHNGRTLYIALVSHDHFVERDAQPENSDGIYSLSFLTRNGKVKHYRLRWSANPPVPAGELIASGRWGAHLFGPFDKPLHPGSGYIYELAIPLSAIGWKPGDTVLLNIIINDRDGTPLESYHAPGAEFARFAWGSFDNDNRTGYKTLKLER